MNISQAEIAEGMKAWFDINRSGKEFLPSGTTVLSQDMKDYYRAKVEVLGILTAAAKVRKGK